MLLGALLALCRPAGASHHYTAKQLDALESRVGRTYWIVSVNGRTPRFLAAPDARAATFQPAENESFEIKELVGRAAKKPYFRALFASGKEGYLSVEQFLEEFNATIVTLDPLADRKKKAAEAAEEEERRLAWIQAQPWSKAVKEAAIARKPVVGMTTGEVRKVVGEPGRVVKIKAPNRSQEEQWFYPDGSILIFQNGMLSRTESREDKKTPR